MNANDPNLSDSPIVAWAYIVTLFPEVTDKSAERAALQASKLPDPVGSIKAAKKIDDGVLRLVDFPGSL